MTDTLAAPSVRIRSRRRVDVVTSDTPQEDAATAQRQAEALAREFIAHTKAANKASADAKRSLKALAALAGDAGLPKFSMVEAGKSYEVGMFADVALDVDVEKLVKEVTAVEFLKLVKSTQGAVKDHGGDALLMKVLKNVQKPAEFKVRAVK